MRHGGEAADTSVLVAAFASWHPAHAAAADALDSAAGVPAHVVVETYSVLTRLPPPHRVRPAVAAEWLRRRLVGQPLAPAGATVAMLPATASELGIAGGAVYDALVALTARDAGARLLTRDLRAIRTYELLGVAYTVVGPL